MRSGDALRRDVLRMAANAAYNVEKRNQKPLTDDEFLAVLTREVKTRRESVDAYTKAGRDDLAAKEQAEIAILDEYLPAALSEAEIGALVDEAVDRDRRHEPARHGQGHGLALPADPWPRRRQGRQWPRGQQARPGGPRRPRPEPALNRPSPVRC